MTRKASTKGKFKIFTYRCGILELKIVAKTCEEANTLFINEIASRLGQLRLLELSCLVGVSTEEGGLESEFTISIGRVLEEAIFARKMGPGVVSP